MSDVSYRWVVKVADRGARVWATDWAGKHVEEIDTDDYVIQPDLNEGKPVIQWIGSGQLAQHFRFETRERGDREDAA